MARFDIQDQSFANADFAGVVNSEVLFQMGILAATGRNGEASKIEAHKWFNLAALKGKTEAVEYRQELTEEMTKQELRLALRSAREWLSVH